MKSADVCRETTTRRNLDSYEQSVERLREIEAAEEEVSAQTAPKPGPKGGRPRGGEREAARRTGIPRDEIRRTKKHVSAADAFPFMQAIAGFAEAAFEAQRPAGRILQAPAPAGALALVS